MNILYRLLFGRVKLRVHSAFRDHRQPWQIERDWDLRYRARLVRNLAAREAQRYVIEFDRDFVPEYLRADVPALLRRQAA